MPPAANLFPALRPVYAFLPVSETLATAGLPSAAQFPLIRDAGFDTVINLAPSSDPRAHEDEDLLVEDCGMEYVSLPVRWQNPTAENVSRFFAEMDDRKHTERIFIHCMANMRVSAFLYLYRVLREGVPEPDARAFMHTIWMPNASWRTFLDERLGGGGLA